jgi:hypothetical protein
MEDELDYPEEDMDLMIDEELQVTEKWWRNVLFCCTFKILVLYIPNYINTMTCSVILRSSALLTGFF